VPECDTPEEVHHDVSPVKADASKYATNVVLDTVAGEMRAQVEGCWAEDKIAVLFGWTCRMLLLSKRNC
jgi:hypothetical protein